MTEIVNMPGITSEIAPAFGPWANDPITAAQRRLRWHLMAALSAVFVGSDHPLTAACLAAGSGCGSPVAAAEAWRELRALPPLPRRRLLATYGALERRVRGDRPRRRA
jgi:hypothetical protein